MSKASVPVTETGSEDLRGTATFRQFSYLQPERAGRQMAIIVFVVDSSTSMYQKTYLGLTLHDAAKKSVEKFLDVSEGVCDELRL
jgi:Mg-chelatase subunit ChlD